MFILLRLSAFGKMDFVLERSLYSFFFDRSKTDLKG